MKIIPTEMKNFYFGTLRSTESSLSDVLLDLLSALTTALIYELRKFILGAASPRAVYTVYRAY